MAGARFVFIADGPGNGDDGVEPDHRIWWRLVAANNRVLGRSIRTVLGEAACRSMATELVDRVDDATTLLTSDGRGRWTWTVSLDGEPRAQCAHPFPRRVDCVRTLALFVDGLRVADPHASVVRFFFASRHTVGSTIPTLETIQAPSISSVAGQ
ncbi:MAG: hypothetical protein QOE97_2981 [Pseudonocardiales bacterium]|jgi:hypothetical protein|nr:hypothetical protein [Pseudonocardiales bacterium]